VFEKELGVQHIQEIVTNLVGGNRLIARYIIQFVAVVTFFAIAHVIFRNWKIQPSGWKLKRTGIELLVAAIGGPITGILMGGLTRLLSLLPPSIHAQMNPAPAAWWVISLEYALFFFAFDAWFYWWHRLMHVEPFYKVIHKVHHWSTSPSPITTFSVTPLESLINGGFLPLFLAFMPLHAASMIFIGPSFIVMGIYVHLGYEFLPRWWNRTWLTKWFITATFHDQHHKYFKYNFGGFTTIWDWTCGTVRPKYVEEFEKIGVKKSAELPTPVAVPAE
jgi:sterol desaturase/sphingolipid hydroxylase (fatty acid hydroxylase superfamily)